MKLTGTAGLVIVIALAIGGGGIARLALDEQAEPSLSAQEARAVAECLPKVELAPGTAVTIGPAVGASGAAAPRLAVVATAAGNLPRNPASAVSGASAVPEPGASQVVFLKKADTPFEMQLSGGSVPARMHDAALAIDSFARFVPPTDTATYPVDISDFVKSHPRAASSDAPLAVPANSVLGQLTLAGPLSVAPVQPVQASIWMENLSPLLVAERVSGQSGLGAVSVDAATPGLRFSATTPPTVFACASVADPAAPADAAAPAWHRIGASFMPAGSGQPAAVRLTLPTDLLPSGFGFATHLRIALASSDGQSTALGDVAMVGRWPAALIALVATAALIGTCMYHRAMAIPTVGNDKRRWISGLFLGSDGTPSLSLLQIFIWTTITVWGFFYVYMVAGRLLSMTPEMMELLGIAGAGTVVARWVAASNAAPGSPSDDDASDDFWQMLSTNGTFDLLKLQLLLFTVVIGMYVVWRIADAGAFPNLDSNTLLLLGVSQGIYVAGKLTSTSDLSKAQAAKATVDTASQALANHQAEQAALQAQQATLSANLAGAKAAGTPTDAIQQQLDSAGAGLTKLTATIAADTSALATAKLAHNQALDALKLN